MTCYTRHEVAPGAHQDIPHEVCMTSAPTEAGIQHDGDFPEHCPVYCTRHNHEEMGG